MYENPMTKSTFECTLTGGLLNSEALDFSLPSLYVNSALLTLLYKYKFLFFFNGSNCEHSNSIKKN
jgi:hypothetical protein